MFIGYTLNAAEQYVQWYCLSANSVSEGLYTDLCLASIQYLLFMTSAEPQIVIQFTYLGWILQYAQSKSANDDAFSVHVWISSFMLNW